MSTNVGKRVLVVDDEMVIADTLALILSQSGFTAHAAYSGEEAIELAAALNPDVLVSDVIMDGVSGIEVAIYYSIYLPSCRILLISGNVLTSSLLEVAGKKGYSFQLISKPVQPETLISHIASNARFQRP